MLIRIRTYRFFSQRKLCLGWTLKAVSFSDLNFELQRNMFGQCHDQLRHNQREKMRDKGSKPWEQRWGWPCENSLMSLWSPSVLFLIGKRECTLFLDRFWSSLRSMKRSPGSETAKKVNFRSFAALYVALILRSQFATLRFFVRLSGKPRWKRVSSIFLDTASILRSQNCDLKIVVLLWCPATKLTSPGSDGIPWHA